MKMTLGRKLGLVFAVIILIYGLMLGFFAYRFSKDYISSDLLKVNGQTVRNVRDYFLENRLTAMSQAVRCWAADPRLVAEDPQGGRHAVQYQQLQAEWKNYLLMNPNAANIYFGSAADGLLHGSPEDIGLPENYDARMRMWYSGAVRSPDQVYWSSPYIDAGEDGALVLTLSKAVVHDGRLLGVIGMDIKLEAFSRMINYVYANDSGSVIILDQWGQVITHPDTGMLAGNISGRQWVRDTLNSEEGTGSFYEKGQQVVYAHATLPETGWKLIGIQEVNLAGLFKNLRMMTIGTAVMMALVMLLGGLLTARYIMKPLRKLMEAIQGVSEGDLNARSRLDSTDELGAISKAFDRMLDWLAEMNIERDGHLETLTEQNQEISLQKQEIHALYEMTDAMNQELETSIFKLQEGYLATVRSLANAIEANDEYTRGHCDRVSRFAKDLGKAADFTARELKNLEYASILHDVGKLGIPDTLINKPGRLTEEEFQLVRRHPAIGAEILDGVAFLEESRTILLQHHERVDGGGYPAGLSGDAIHPAARILAIADSYDAMTSNRPYRMAPLSHEEALKELERGRGTQFDPFLTDRFIAMMAGMPPANEALDLQESPDTAVLGIN